jgi:hypothetical protein
MCVSCVTRARACVCVDQLSPSATPTTPAHGAHTRTHSSVSGDTCVCVGHAQTASTASVAPGEVLRRTTSLRVRAISLVLCARRRAVSSACVTRMCRHRQVTAQRQASPLRRRQQRCVHAHCVRVRIVTRTYHRPTLRWCTSVTLVRYHMRAHTTNVRVRSILAILWSAHARFARALRGVAESALVRHVMWLSLSRRRRCCCCLDVLSLC